MASSDILAVTAVATKPFDGQKPGTSGLRKKTRIFCDGLYLHNFVQCIFDTIPRSELQGATLVVGGDGRCVAVVLWRGWAPADPRHSL